MARYLGSFEYKVTDEHIQKILKNRSYLDNTVQVAMPFVKATTTIQLPDILGDECWGFSIGLHSINEDVRWDNMFGSTGAGSGYPLIGYTHDYSTGGKPKLVYAEPPSSQVGLANRFFDGGKNLVSTSQLSRIAPPGITNMTVGRNKNGLLSVAEMTVSVPTLQQLELLHRVFLIPGCGMIVEWGQQFAKEATPITDYLEYTELTTLPWHNKQKMDELFKNLARRKIGLTDILKDYVYPNNGQYMWMFGRVANFTTTGNPDGSYECKIKVVGSSEDQWAYSTRTTVIPAVSNTNQFCVASSISKYFNDTAVGYNLKSLLDAIGANPSHAWYAHVVHPKQHSQSEGDKTTTPSKPETSNVDKSKFGESDDAYFFTWRFFVNVVLNDPKVGLMALFSGLTPDEKSKVGFLRPYANTDGTPLQGSGPQYLNDPFEPYIGRNKYLRSTDPGTLVIAHQAAVGLARQRLSARFPDEETLINTHFDLGTSAAQAFIGGGVGDFGRAANEVKDSSDGDVSDRGLLSTGVWLNHKAVCRAMEGADTFLRGVHNLLEAMNAASFGYWQLALDPIEAAPGDKDNPENKTNFTVIDVNWRDSSQKAVDIALDKLYVFNKYARTGQDNKLVGSELLECTVDLSLPKLLFSQIATLGLVQREDIPEAKDPNAPPPTNKSILVSDANETLRKMFSITTLDIKSEEQGPDLTMLPFGQRQAVDQCFKQNSSTTGQGGGVGMSIADVSLTRLGGASGATTTTPSAITEASGSVANTTDRAQLNQQATDWLAENEEACNKAGCFPTSPSSELSGTWITSNSVTDSNKLTTILQGRTSVPGGTAVIAQVDTGQVVRRIGTRNWRNHNPGNISFGDFASRNGAIGSDGRFAIFPDYQTGRTAKERLLFQTAGYRDLTITKAIERYAPPSENDTALYQRTVINAVGGDFILKNMTSDQRNKMLNAMERVEGFKVGTIEVLRDSTTPPTPVPEVPKTQQCYDCVKQKAIQIQTQKVADAIKPVLDKERQFPYLREVLAFIEMFPEDMVTAIRGDADDNKANAFGAAPGSLSISADLVMPGVNGLRVGELFWIDRIPAFYRAFGAFQVLSIEDVISLDGWKTKIHSRFHYLGSAWKKAVLKRLQEVVGDNT